MSIGKKVAYSAEKTRGRAKKVYGRAVGNRRLEAQGRAAQIKGSLKLSAAKVRDAFRK
ncbi:CsbD family protein [Nocardia lasii]|uniref:CsbD family protein n=1 Tax=Nocardia lasii TaxID=1616107 RepID=A0ABW1JPH9_9NOCA